MISFPKLVGTFAKFTINYLTEEILVDLRLRRQSNGNNESVSANTHSALFCIVVNVLIRVYASSPLFVCLVVVMLLFLYSHMQGNR